MKRKIALSVSILSVIVLHEFFRRQIDVFIGLRAETTGKVLLGSEFEIVVYLFCWFFIPMLCVLLLFFKPSVIPAPFAWILIIILNRCAKIFSLKSCSPQARHL